jgi:5'-nucleotidase
VYRDELSLLRTEDGGRRQFRIYGEADYERDEIGTDLAAVARGLIAVTPIHFDLTYGDDIAALTRHDLGRLLAPAADEIAGA